MQVIYLCVYQLSVRASMNAAMCVSSGGPCSVLFLRYLQHSRCVSYIGGCGSVSTEWQ